MGIAAKLWNIRLLELAYLRSQCGGDVRFAEQVDLLTTPSIRLPTKMSGFRPSILMPNNALRCKLPGIGRSRAEYRRADGALAAAAAAEGVSP